MEVLTGNNIPLWNNKETLSKNLKLEINTFLAHGYWSKFHGAISIVYQYHHLPPLANYQESRRSNKGIVT